jgi:hypothetical protein
MATKLDLQREILEELNDYIGKLIDAVQRVSDELGTGRKEDTDEFSNYAIQGINWVIEVFNNCEDIINKNEKKVDKSAMAQAVTRLGAGLREHNDTQVSACLKEDFLPFLRTMEQISGDLDEICGQN